MTCWTRPVARSQTSTTIAMAGSVCTRAGSVAQGPVRIQNAPSSYRYQVGRTVGPLAATRAVSGWARKASTSKGGGCVTGSFSDPSRPVASRIAGGHHLARRTRVRSRSNLARSYSWRYRSGDPAVGRCRAAHGRAAGNQRLLARGAAHLVHAGGRYPAHAGRVGAPLLLPTGTAVGDVALVDVAGNLGGRHRVIAERGSGGPLGHRPARGLLRGRLLVAGQLQQSLHRAGRGAAQRLSGPGGAGDGGDAVVGGQPGDQTGQESRSAGPEPHLGWLPDGDRPRKEGGKI